MSIFKFCILVSFNFFFKLGENVKIASWIVLFYGLMIFFGGIMGYMMAGSIASFIWGTISGILLITASIGMFKNRLIPAYFAIILTLLLDAFFTYRFLYTFKFFPPGIMAFISLVVLIAIVLLLRRGLSRPRRKKPKSPQ